MSERQRLNLHVSPSSIENASRLHRFSQALQDSGLFTRTDIVGMSRDHLSDREEIGPSRFITRLPATASIGALARFKAAATFGWWLEIFRRYWTEDVAVVAAHNVWTLPGCWLLSRRTGAVLAYNAHELETETPTMRGLKQVAARAIERVFAHRAGVVTVVNPSIADWYREHLALDAVSVRNIPIATTSDERVDLRARLDVPDHSLLFVHTGRLVHGRNIPAILSAFQDDATEHHVVFFGDGPLGDSVDKAATACARIHRLEPVEPSAVVPHVRGADAALCLIELDALSYRYSSPNKLFEGIAAGVPVFCTDLAEARRIYGAAFAWLLVETPEVDLVRALHQHTVGDWAGWSAQLPVPDVGSWDDEGRLLVEAYSRTLAGAVVRNK